MITQVELKEILKYDKKSGKFIWLKSHDYRIKVGAEAGFKVGNYWKVSYKNIKYMAHRLAWFYVTGVWPKEQIDHINNNPLDNSWNNLREATASQNLANKPPQKNSTTKLKGVSYDRGKIRADITYQNKLYFLGFFDTLEEAAKAYDNKAIDFYAEFAYLNFPD